MDNFLGFSYLRLQSVGGKYKHLYFLHTRVTVCGPDSQHVGTAPRPTELQLVPAAKYLPLRRQKEKH